MKKNPPRLEMSPRDTQEQGGVKAALMFLGAVFKAEQGDKEPAFESRSPMDHWACSISTSMGRCRVDYWMGSGHNGRAPSLMDIAESYASDAACVWYDDLESFADNLGYSLDDKEQLRNAKRAYKGCQKALESIKKLLGPLWDAALRDNWADLAREAAALCQEQPRFASLEASRGNALGLLELSALCAEPASLAAALSEDPELDRLREALMWLSEGPASEDPTVEECQGALESFVARKELMGHVPAALTPSAPRGL